MNEDHEDLVSVYTGTDVTANILKEYLLEVNIPSVLKSEHDSSIVAIGACEVYLFEHDLEKAKPLIEEFKYKNS